MPQQQKTSALTLRFRAKDICCCRNISTALSQQKTSAGISTKPIPDALFICAKAKRKQLNIGLDVM
ncbi:hypothetical protein [Lysinibacillus xylanilyticus]|uniref:hypothetical protein n=1 Tax=Lysinibacillus xylanilyticus TaxID=582475 RepID=UPI003D061771